MSISTITVGGNVINLVAFPTTPGLRMLDWSFDDAVSAVTSPFTQLTQTQQWMGGDMLRAVCTTPPLAQSDADAWICALMEMRGMANAMQLGDPMRRAINGSGGTLTANGAQAAGSQTLAISGGTGSAILLPGDWIQIGYRLYRILDTYNTTVTTVNIFPSLREALAGGESIVTANTLGIFRLATNKRAWAVDYQRLTQISFQVQEYR